MTATLSMGGEVGSATPAASAWVKSADPWPTRISVLRPFLGRAGAERRPAPSLVCSALARRARRWRFPLLAVITCRAGPDPESELEPDPGTDAPAHPPPPTSIRLPASCCYHRSGPGAPLCLPFRGGFPQYVRKAAPIMGDAALEQAPDGRTAGQSQGSGKGPELALRTGSRLAGREVSLRCLLGARVPSQAQPPVQPVPRSSPSRRAGRRSGWLP